MKGLIRTFALLLALSIVASAQTGKQYRGQGYLFFAPGVTGDGAGTVRFGGGGEGFVYKGLGVGAEIGYLAPWSSFNDGVAAGSANLSYHLLPKTDDKKIEPFVTTGYSIFARAGVSHGFNVGGGVNLWLSERGGLRLEIRDDISRGPISSRSSFASDHFVSFRIGVAFR